MPRAKRTDRAEARRRYRASLDAIDGEDSAEVLEAPPASSARGGAPRPVAPGRPVAPAPERPSIGRAFRSSFRPVTLAEDLRTFPALLRHRAVWLPILLTVLAGVFFVVTRGQNPLVAIIATYFIAPPALGSVFLAGFLAPRSSYLIGFLVGLVSAIVASAIVLSSGSTLNPDGSVGPNASPSPSVVASASAAPSAVTSPGPSASAVPAASAASTAPSGSAAPAGSPIPSPSPRTATSSQDQVIYAFLTSPPFGMFFAATAAWYRRFLRMSNPNRGRQQPVRRGNDGRSRGNQRTRR